MRFAESEKLASRFPQMSATIAACDQRLFSLDREAIIDVKTWAASVHEDEHRVRAVLDGLSEEGLLVAMQCRQCECGSVELRPEITRACAICGQHGDLTVVYQFSPRHNSESRALSEDSSSDEAKQGTIIEFKRNKDEIDAVAQLLRAGRIMPFVGAGLSIPCGYPGWTSFLLDEAEALGLKDQVQTDIASGAYEMAAERLSERHGAFAFDRRIRHVYGARRDLAGAILHLPRIVKTSLITTNFDESIERAFFSQGRQLAQVVGANFASMTGALFEMRPHLLKMHGDAFDSEARVLTQSEYNRHYGNGPPWTTPLPTTLARLFSSTSLLFIGCSLSADRTMAVLEQSAEMPIAPTHYAIVEAPIEPDAFAARQRELGKHRIAAIWYPAKEQEWVALLLDIIARTSEQ